ncbi:MAG: hypothetical protein K1X88_12035 [Nannocystaceae bacterium]|nr:hypothetical protein [Nannocystaceae bacterium]
MPIRTIEPLTPDHRHAQTPVVLSPAHQHYEWWYFEVELVDGDGKPYRVITSFHFPHGMDPHRLLAYQHYKSPKVDYYAKYGTNPAHFAGVASYVVDVQARKNIALLIARFPKADIGTRVQVSRPGDPSVRLIFGDSSFVQNFNGTYTLRVHHGGMALVGATPRKLRIDLDVTFTPDTDGFQPHEAVLLDQGGVRHHWACVMPNPSTFVESCVVQRERVGGAMKQLLRARANVAGHGGYHDHQWGADLVYRQIRRWYWGRVPTGARGGDVRPRDRVLFFDVLGTSTQPSPILVDVPGGGGTPSALVPVAGKPPLSTAGDEHINFADGCRLGIQGQDVPYPRWINLRAQTSGGSTRNFDIEHRVSNNVDTWPFYLRFAPGVLDPHTGRTFASVSEVLQASRMDDERTQKVLALSDKITVGA